MGSQAGTAFHYDALDRQTNVVACTAAEIQSVTNFFDVLGWAWQVGLPNGRVMTKAYWDTGELRGTYDDQAYPAEYGYDYARRMTSLTTWTNAAAKTGAATTGWGYNSMGYLTGKSYTNSTSVGYTSTSAGKPKTRTWVRSVTTTYIRLLRQVQQFLVLWTRLTDIAMDVFHAAS